MIHDAKSVSLVPHEGFAYRQVDGSVRIYANDRWQNAKVVYTVFGVAPEAVELDLAEEPSPGRASSDRLHWKETAIAENDAWPNAEVTNGIGIMTLRMDAYGDDPASYLLEVAGWSLKQVEQRWRHVAHTLVPATLWRELEPVS